jgi:hypothetical protein
MWQDAYSKVIFVASTGCLIAGLTQAIAAEPTLARPEQKYLVSQKKFQFYLRGYKQRVIVDPKAYKPGIISRVDRTPDLVAIEALVAKVQGHPQEYLAFLQEAYRSRYESDLRKEHGSLKGLAANWANRYRGSYIELLKHINTELNTIIWYRIFNAATNKEVESEGLALRLGPNGHWQLIDLSDSVVYQHWRFEGRTRVIRE